MNNHCDYVSIEVAHGMMERLGIKTKKEFTALCGCKDYKQFSRWEKKGRMPEYRLSTLQRALHKKAKEQYDEMVKAIYGE